HEGTFYASFKSWLRRGGLLPSCHSRPTARTRSNAYDTPMASRPIVFDARETQVSLGAAVSIAVWFGIFAGMVEGAGLLLFQRINWRRWGPMVHAAKEIIWISAVLDVLLFTLLALLVHLAVRASRRIPELPVLSFLLIFLSVYDWLTLTERLYHRSCILLGLGVAAALTRWLSRNRE